MQKLVAILLCILAQTCIGQVWSKLPGDTLGGPAITAMYSDGTYLYIAGGITNAGSLGLQNAAYYDGINWYDMAGGMGGGAYTIEKYDTNIYYGGSFSNAGGNVNADNIAYWDGATWNELGVPSTPVGTHKELAEYDGNLYTTGTFTELFGVQTYFIAMWDGNQIWDVDGGLSGGTTNGKCLAVYDDKLVVGGTFGMAGSTPAFYIATWDGTQWEELGGGLNGWASEMVVDTVNQILYVSGAFTLTGDGTPVSYIAKWNGERWYDVGGGIDDTDANEMIMYRNQLYLTGNFTAFSGDSIDRIARYNGVSYDSLGTGLNGFAGSMAIFNDELYVGGNFTSAGDTAVNLVAKWYMHPDTACLDMVMDIAWHPDTIYTSQLPYTFRSNSYSNATCLWDFGDGHTDSTGHATYDFGGIPGTYDIYLAGTCGSGYADTARSQVVIVDNVGVDELSSNVALNVYPNPTSGVFTVELKTLKPRNGSGAGLQGDGEVVLKVFNVAGELVEEKTLKQVQGDTPIVVDSNGWGKGTYIIKLEAEDITGRAMVVVE